MFNTLAEAREAFAQDREFLEASGIYPLPETYSYTPNFWGKNFRRASAIAMDAQPVASLTNSAGIPWYLLNYVDPQRYKIIFAPVSAAKITGEERKGDWKSATAMFPVVEHVGETSSYGDYSNNGMTNVNSNFPQRQNYRYQTIIRYGELEMEQAGEARLNWVSELNASATNNMMRFENFVYFFGVAGLQNYGLINDPNLNAFLTPAVKSYGGTTWFVGNTLKATPNEVFNDILACFQQLTSQSAGTVTEETKLVLALHPALSVAFKAPNSFGLTCYDMLEDNFPNIRIEKAVQYGALTASNTQGIAGGNMMQMIAEDIEGQKPGYCAYSEKLRSHPIIRDLSSFKQKSSGGAWGAVIRMPVGFVSMLGI